MPTYIYLSHGSECVVEEGGAVVPNRRQVVPPGCTLSTITESGVASRESDVRRLMRMSSVAQTRALMIDPVTNHDLLSSIFEGVNDEYLMAIPEYKGQVNAQRMGHEQYHLKVEGDPFTQRPFEFLFYGDISEDPIEIRRSGLYDIEVFPPPLDGYTVHAHYETPSVSLQEFIELFRGSVFPTQQDLMQVASSYPQGHLYNFQEIADIVLKITDGVLLSSLMERFRGNHYNFTCRSHPEGVNNASVQRVRRNSITQSKRATPFKNAKYQEFLKRKKELEASQLTNIDVIKLRLSIFVRKGQPLNKRQIEVVGSSLETIKGLLKGGEQIEDAEELKKDIRIISSLVPPGTFDFNKLLAAFPPEGANQSAAAAGGGSKGSTRRRRRRRRSNRLPRS
jgi:hypothetical protein